MKALLLLLPQLPCGCHRPPALEKTELRNDGSGVASARVSHSVPSVIPSKPAGPRLVILRSADTPRVVVPRVEEQPAVLFVDPFPMPIIEELADEPQIVFAQK